MRLLDGNRQKLCIYPLSWVKNADGSVSKLSKRHGAVSFSQLISEGFLIDAVLNYIALLGWSPKQEREIFSLDELIEIFNIEGTCKNQMLSLITKNLNG